MIGEKRKLTLQKRGIERKLDIWTCFCKDVLSPFLFLRLHLDSCKLLLTVNTKPDLPWLNLGKQKIVPLNPLLGNKWKEIIDNDSHL